MSYLKNNSLLMASNFKLDDLLWKVSETEGYLAEYRGRLTRSTARWRYRSKPKKKTDWIT